MPQKKNPDVFELVRGRSGQGIGALVQLFTIIKGLPGGYNRDLQEDRAPLLGHGRERPLGARCAPGGHPSPPLRRRPLPGGAGPRLHPGDRRGRGAGPRRGAVPVRLPPGGHAGPQGPGGRARPPAGPGARARPGPGARRRRSPRWATFGRRWRGSAARAPPPRPRWSGRSPRSAVPRAEARTAAAPSRGWRSSSPPSPGGPDEALPPDAGPRARGGRGGCSPGRRSSSGGGARATSRTRSPGKTVVLLMEKASTRTRLSFAAAAFQLGGHAIELTAGTSQIARGEPLSDTARVVSSYCRRGGDADHRRRAARGVRPLELGAGHQRAHRRRTPGAGADRPVHRRGVPRRGRRSAHRLRRRRVGEHGALVPRGGAAVRLHAAARRSLPSSALRPPRPRPPGGTWC